MPSRRQWMLADAVFLGVCVLGMLAMGFGVAMDAAAGAWGWALSGAPIAAVLGGCGVWLARDLDRLRRNR